MQFYDVLAQDVEYCRAIPRQVIVPAAAKSRAGLGFAPQPPVPLHALQQRVQCPRTDVVAVPSELGEDPLADYRVFCRVMEDVNFPEA
jgi:hypothetical protein